MSSLKLKSFQKKGESEKLFRGDKSYLGNKSLRVQSNEVANAKIFVEFVALIIRCKMYTMLKDEMKKKELLTAVEKSGKSYDEIMRFLMECEE